MGLLDELIDRIDQADDDTRQQLEAQVRAVKDRILWVPNPGPQTEAYFSEADVLLYGGEAGGGKLLDLATPLPTPSGWTNVGAIVPGDILFDEAGNTCRVLALSAIEEAPVTYRITFDDGATVISCADHRWRTFDAKELGQLFKLSPAWRERRRMARPSRATGKRSAKFTSTVALLNSTRSYVLKDAPRGTVRTTSQIAETLTVRGGRANHAIEVCGPLNLPDIDLPVPPYTLGAWLGDGTAVSGAFTGIDREIWERIEDDGFAISHGKNGKSHHIRGIIRHLRRAGVAGNKHIPPQYLRASVVQRLALLQGLMDTDGHATTNGQCEFDNTNEHLVRGVHELVLSLGIKATIQVGTAKLKGRIIGPKWRIKFVSRLPVFHLPRKAARMKSAHRQTTRFRYIKSCERIAPKPMRCIAVDSPSRLFLCGERFIPTHNSDLLLGLAFNEHQSSLIMRRQYTDLSALTERAIEINGSRRGFNASAPPKFRTRNGRKIDFGAAANEGDERAWQGRAHDLLGVDEVPHFARMQIRFLMGWIRSVKEGQRKRCVLCGNPPIDEDGLWIVEMFAPWLDPQHENPAEPGELRWFVTDQRTDEDIEVDGPEPCEIDGRILIPLSRTFIPAGVDDNPFLKDDYKAQLDALPEPYRSAFRDGNFLIARRDDLKQVIPTGWVREAMQRWRDIPPTGVPMCAIGLDVAAGGKANTVLAPRFDAWYPKLKKIPGVQTPTWKETAGLVVAERQDNALVIVDLGGGWGGEVYAHLLANGIDSVGYMGVSPSNERTKDGRIGFKNTRSCAHWRFREALDPAQPGGSPVELPPDPRLLADLTAPRFEVTPRGIEVESKDDVIKRLKRSPDDGDAVIMAWTGGQKAAMQRGGWQEQGRARRPQVNVGAHGPSTAGKGRR